MLANIAATGACQELGLTVAADGGGPTCEDLQP
jgi:hypothetical protein